MRDDREGREPYTRPHRPATAPRDDIDTHCLIRPYRPADRDAVNRVALAAFSQYAHAYADWPAFSARIARTSDLAGEADCSSPTTMAR